MFIFYSNSSQIKIVMKSDITGKYAMTSIIAIESFPGCSDIEWYGSHFGLCSDNEYREYQSSSSFVWVNKRLWVVDNTTHPIISKYYLNKDNKFILYERHYLYKKIPNQSIKYNMDGITFNGENFWSISSENNEIYKVIGLL